MLVVKMYSPDNYAAGGAPAPEIMVADGGFALAKGKNGVGPLFSNQVYMVANYITPELPGRQVCSGELQDWGQHENDVMDSVSVPVSPNIRNPSTLAVSNAAYATPTPTPRGFHQDESRWVANSYDGGETVKVTYLSDAYFSLANSRRDLASALRLGAEVVIDGGDAFYEIQR